MSNAEKNPTMFSSLTVAQKERVKDHVSLSKKIDKHYEADLAHMDGLLELITYTSEYLAENCDGDPNPELRHMVKVLYGISSAAQQCIKLLPFEMASFMDDLVTESLNT